MDPVSHAAAALKEWSRQGLVIIPVWDGEMRQQLKQQLHLNREKGEQQMWHHLGTTTIVIALSESRPQRARRSTTTGIRA